MDTKCIWDFALTRRSLCLHTSVTSYGEFRGAIIMAKVEEKNDMPFSMYAEEAVQYIAFLYLFIVILSLHYLYLLWMCVVISSLTS